MNVLIRAARRFVFYKIQFCKNLTHAGTGKTVMTTFIAETF